MKKYSSYKGKIDKIAPNILARDFKAAKSNENWVTDVTAFLLAGEKLYLSAILFNGEIIPYNIESRPVSFPKCCIKPLVAWNRKIHPFSIQFTMNRKHEGF